MPVYNFKSMKPVPTAPELVDIVLQRTQRRTPTVVHPGYKISRIRSFYMRKIKFTQQTISERLTTILTDFPRLNDIHPFYADLCNTLYDRDHYKLALGQINTARGLVDSIARDMIRMVKYGDSLYRCKCLKRAALGRMCTVLKRQKAALAYLEEVRKHMSRLPALDPHTRTLLITGFPNVGKSSFMNKITRGNVDVQPYAFTTKSLFVGHCDYKYLRWQVIDTPGILDHALEDRNTIEMQAVIALAHLQCAVLYFIDVSEQCGYSIEQQCSLFRGIRPLFANKQLLVVVNKIDQQPWETLQEDKRAMIEGLCESAAAGTGSTKCQLLTMSNVSEEGVSNVKIAACEKLLEARVDARVAAGQKKMEHVLNRLQVFHPEKRDNVSREPSIPESVLRAREEQQKQQQGEGQDVRQRSKIGYAPTVNDVAVVNGEDDDDGDVEMADDNKKKKKTARDLMWENGGPGVWAPDYREQYDLKHADWNFDAVPEILDGKNVADYIDPDILQKLHALEREEEQLQSELQAAGMGEEEESVLDEEEEAAVQAIRERKKKIKAMKFQHQTQNKPMKPHVLRGKMRDHKDDVGPLDERAIHKSLDNVGVDASKMLERGRARERDSSRKRDRSLSRSSITKDDDDKADDVNMEDGTEMSRGQAKKAKKARKESQQRELSLARSHSKPRTPSQSGIKDNDDGKMIKAVQKLERAGRKAWEGGAGEGDQRKAVHLVKWMNTGKKRMGTTYCR